MHREIGGVSFVALRASAESLERIDQAVDWQGHGWLTASVTEGRKSYADDGEGDALQQWYGASDPAERCQTVCRFAVRGWGFRTSRLTTRRSAGSAGRRREGGEELLELVSLREGPDGEVGNPHGRDGWSRKAQVWVCRGDGQGRGMDGKGSRSHYGYGHRWTRVPV